ncbi:MAG: 6-phosphogluconolactonase [Actinobacteria bacterium]|nr:6-phosphogluconolactonase [Actinomycetota bacterium]MCL5447380.1 6-phosphogluconolactonase [Actinomycetota bacterium]
MTKTDGQAIDSSHCKEPEKVTFDPPGLTGRMLVPNGEMLIVRDVPAAFCSIVAATLRQSPHSQRSIALSGGPTAKKCYEALSAYSVSPGMDWSNVTVFMSDERCVPMDHPDSNGGMVRDTLVAKIGKLGAFHPMDCVAGPEVYGNLISGVLPFDLVHLGMGPDGHTASLFPGSPLLNYDPSNHNGSDSNNPSRRMPDGDKASDHPPGTSLVALSRDPNRLNPHDRMTLTLPAINASRHAIFTVAGKEKLQAMKRVGAGDDIPALRVHASTVVWIVDEDAAP